MNIDLQLLAGWISAVTLISTPLWFLYSKGQKLVSRLENLEGWTQLQQEDIENSAEARRILLTATLSCLKCLQQQQGEDASVSGSIKELEDFLMAEAHRMKSEGRRVA